MSRKIGLMRYYAHRAARRRVEAAQRSDVQLAAAEPTNAASRSIGERSCALAGSTSREVGTGNSTPECDVQPWEWLTT